MTTHRNDNHCAKHRVTDLSQTRTGAKRFAAKDFPYANDSVTTLCNGIMTPDRRPHDICDSKIWMAVKVTPQNVVFASWREATAAVGA
jgi:hypothetical protein